MHRHGSRIPIFLTILSGGPEGEREYAGVGFLVSPHMRQHIIGFNDHTNQWASLHIRVQGCKIQVFTIYAPENGLDVALRHSFFDELA